MPTIRSGSLSDLIDLKNKLVTSKPPDLQKDTLFFDFNNLLQCINLTYASGSSNDQWFIILNDTLSICLLRMLQLAKATKTSFGINQNDSDLILKYVVRYLNHKSTALINSLMSLLTKLIAFNTFENPQLFQNLLKEIIPLIMSQKLTKILYNVLELIIRSLNDKQYVLLTHPEIPKLCIDAVSDDHVANAASKTFVAIFLGTYNKDITKEWYESWRKLVMKGLSKESSRQNIVTYLLPNFTQVCPASLNLLISEYSQFEIEKDMVIMDILMNLYKIGQENSIPIDLPDNLFSLLTHYDPKFRLNALSLLLGGSAKNLKSLPIPEEVYQMIRDSDCIHSFMNDYEDIEARNRFVSLFTHFLGFRYKESIYSLQKELGKLAKKKVDGTRQEAITEIVKSGESFIEWLIEYLISYLNPASNYSQLVTSIQLLGAIASKLKNTPNCNIYKDKLIHFLIQNLFNNYENIREMSLELLSACDPLIIQRYFELNQLQAQLVNQSYTILTSLTGRKSDGAAKFFEFLTIYFLKIDSFKKITQIIDSMIVRMSYGINLLKEGSSLERSEVYIHGYFKAMDLMFKRLADSHFDYIKMISLTIIDLIFDIWTLVEPILSSSAIEEEEDVIDDDKILLNYSWKVIKDSNILLSQILKMNVVSKETFLRCSVLIMSQLSSVKHRGAFSSIYPSFISICQLCFESTELKEYPFIWLKENLKLIENKEQLISRRSGGIPYLITGVLVGADIKNHTLDKIGDNQANTWDRSLLLQFSFDHLLSVAKRPYYHDSKNDIPQVHAFNSIKQIFNEAPLAKESYDYVERSLELSLNNFYSENWSIRNCAVMLFGTIQRRIFGSRNESRYPYQLFFERFPKMDQILHKELTNVLQEDAIQDIFPVIIILLKLDTTSGDDNSILAKYKPLLIRLLSNKYWKIREMLASCISTFFTQSELFSMAVKFFGVNPDIEDNLGNLASIYTSTNLNEVQGYLRVISESFERINVEFRTSLQDTLLDKMEFVISKYKSPFIIKAYIEIVLQFDDCLPVDCLNLLGNYLINSSLYDEGRLDGGRQLVLSDTIKLLLSNYKRYYITTTDPSYLESMVDLIGLGLISSNMFRVQLAAIEFIKSNFDEIKYSLVPQIKQNIIEVIANDVNFNYVRAQALSVYSTILDSCESPNSGDVKSLLPFIGSRFTEDIQLNSLQCIATLLLTLDKLDQDRLVEECREFSGDHNSFKYRHTAFKSLIRAHKSYKGVTSIQKSRIELHLVFGGLYDDDESIRGMSAGYLSQYLGKSSKINSSTLGRQCLLLFAQTGGVWFKMALLEEFHRHSLNSTEIDNLNQSTVGETLFDVENNNLYLNRVEVALSLSAAFEQVEEFTPQELNGIQFKINQDISWVIDLAQRKGPDAALGWTRDPRVYGMVLVTVLNSETVSSLTGDDKTWKKLKAALFNAKIDLCVSQFIQN